MNTYGKIAVAVMSAALVALIAVIILFSPYATMGWRYTHTKRPLAPLLAKLQRPVPAYPGTEIGGDGCIQDRLIHGVAPYHDFPGQERYAICSHCTYLRLDVSGIRSPEADHPGISGGAMQRIEQYYVDYLKSCGLVFGGESGTGRNGRVLEAWSGPDVGSGVRCFAYVLVRPDPRDDMGDFVLVHVLLYADGFTDSAGRWPPQRASMDVSG